MEQHYQKNGHLEDYDSAKGDVEAGSRGATAANSASTRRQADLMCAYYNEGISRGKMYAQSGQGAETVMSPDKLMNRILNNGDDDDGDDGGFSVNTGQMEDAMDDTYTYDGSTITSAHNSHSHRHSNTSARPVVLDWSPAHGRQPAQQPHPYHNTNHSNSHSYSHNSHTSSHPGFKADPSYGTEATSSSHSNGSNNKKARAEKEQRKKAFCCGLGKCGVVLVLLTVLALVLGALFWLFLSYLPSQASQDSPSTIISGLPCCKGYFVEDLNGQQICNTQDNGQNRCCLVCDSSAQEEKPAPEEEEEEEEETKSTPVPSPSPVVSTKAPVASTTAPVASTTASPVASTSKPTAATTAAATPEPTAASTPGPTAAPTPNPTVAATKAATNDPTASPTDIPVDTTDGTAPSDTKTDANNSSNRPSIAQVAEDESP